jgi:hypothetical protein
MEEAGRRSREQQEITDKLLDLVRRHSFIND